MSPPAASTSAPAADATDSSIIEAYCEVQSRQREMHTELALLPTDAQAGADLARWTLFLARTLRQRDETAHNALYVLFAYNASIRTETGRADFVRYNEKDTVCMRGDESLMVYTISSRFKNNMSRRENCMLIAATCLCIASKMQEGQYRAILRPGDIICAMKAGGNVLGENKVYDFITVERDVLETLQWRLFRVHGPIFYTEMLFNHFAVADADQLLTHDFLTRCLSSPEYVFAVPSDLAAICLVAALYQNNTMVSSAAVASFAGVSTAFLLEHTARVTQMPLRRPPCITRLADE
jgi:hypothetical protein